MYEDFDGYIIIFVFVTSNNQVFYYKIFAVQTFEDSQKGFFRIYFIETEINDFFLQR